jgi:segregation and condensation protein B
VLYRTTPLFLKLFGLQSLDALPDPTQWDPTPEEQAGLRERLLRAGEARAGLAAVTSEPDEPSRGPALEREPEPEPAA